MINVMTAGKEILKDGYSPTWKILKGYFNWDTIKFYDDETCEWYEEMYRLWQKSLYESYGKYSEYRLRKLFGLLGSGGEQKNETLSNQLDSDDIKESCVLSDAIKRYTNVFGEYEKKTARCPFHEDNKPSLSIDDKKGLWYCFPCGQGGDVFTFVQKVEECDFKTALKIVSEYAVI